MGALCFLAKNQFDICNNLQTLNNDIDKRGFGNYHLTMQTVALNLTQGDYDA
jgi:hypothetical protein